MIASAVLPAVKLTALVFRKTFTGLPVLVTSLLHSAGGILNAKYVSVLNLDTSQHIDTLQLKLSSPK